MRANKQKNRTHGVLLQYSLSWYLYLTVEIKFGSLCKI